ncbi:MAG: hypothetical protein K6F40_07415 [Bacteroidales bacterium]|nr:hypothetical protein [Bacteroidales bacterium]
MSGCVRCSLSDVRRWFVAVMWSPWPVCLVWIHRRGCSLDVGLWPLLPVRCAPLGCRLGDVVAGVVSPSARLLSRCGIVAAARCRLVVDVSGCVRCSLSDVRRWFVAVMLWPWWSPCVRCIKKSVRTL